MDELGPSSCEQRKRWRSQWSSRRQDRMGVGTSMALTMVERAIGQTESPAFAVSAETHFTAR
eukprot:5869052-Pleurochrysis_carterae.AAC.1